MFDYGFIRNADSGLPPALPTQTNGSGYNFVNLRKTASKLITYFGASASITRVGDSTFDPATGAYSGGSTSTITAKAVRAQFTQAEKASELVQENDIKMLLESGRGVPFIDDNVLFEGINYRVMDVKVISPSGTDVYYELHIRN